MKANIICADPPWGFKDRLTMSKTKRGAEANYNTMSTDSIKKIPIWDICEDDALLALWVPSSLLQDGLDVMSAWGFQQKQTWIWVKTKKEPLKDIIKSIKNSNTIDLNTCLAFFMGRYFRACHELCLIGIKGKIHSQLKDMSQRSVALDSSKKHSEKTEILQERLELMFPIGNKVELFGRRARDGWVVLGNQSPDCSEDIFDAIERIKNL